MTNKQAWKLRTDDKLRWIADGTLGEITEMHLEHGRAYWFNVKWTDGQVNQYMPGRVSDVEYLEKVS